MFAIEAKLEALCDKLIEQGADINAKDHSVPPLPSIMRASAKRGSLTLFFMTDLVSWVKSGWSNLVGRIWLVRIVLSS